MKRSYPRKDFAKRPASGFLLIEVLVAVLIFGFGVLAIIGLQAASMKDASQAKYRADASMLVEDLIGRMWASDRTAATLASNFGTGGAKFNEWLTSAQSVLPGIDTTQTAVTVQPQAAVGSSNPTSIVTVTLAWKSPNEGSAAQSHQVSVITQISD